MLRSQVTSRRDFRISFPVFIRRALLNVVLSFTQYLYKIRSTPLKVLRNIPWMYGAEHASASSPAAIPPSIIYRRRDLQGCRCGPTGRGGRAGPPREAHSQACKRRRAFGREREKALGESLWERAFGGERRDLGDGGIVCGAEESTRLG